MKLKHKIMALCLVAPVALAACGGNRSSTLPDGRKTGDPPKDPPPPGSAMVAPSAAPVVLA